MEIKAETMKRCELVTVAGRVDSSTAPELEKVLLGLIQSGQKNIVVNMKDTDFISSAGLKALLSALMKVRKMIPSGDVVISEIRPELRESFDLVGFDRLFTFHDDNMRAVGSF
ncbi:MAG: STAS domain-containing protein [Anaerolineae bacterium]|jgi:anti-anti-sigma factor